ERCVEVVVSDEGPGIPEDEQALVFERFTRGSTVLSAGVGLGLYIARAYVEAMGGTIGVRNTPGHGACFWFRLPRAATRPLTVPTEPTVSADVQAQELEQTREVARAGA
ncbi:MAG TPA: ATP-binding protein, partial [Chloroflexota bacterium]|nr:ATP-binding protein [Chloroflexota bacterium]